MLAREQRSERRRKVYSRRDLKGVEIIWVVKGGKRDCDDETDKFFYII